MKSHELRTLSDEELVALSVDAANAQVMRASASELFGRHQDKIYLWCFRYVRDHEIALDLAQEVMLKAYRSLQSFQGRSRFSSWLFTISRNHCLTRMQSAQLGVVDELDPEDLSTSSDSPEQILEEKEGEERLLALIQKHLTRQEQDAIWLRCIERVPVDEITRVLEIQISTGARGVLQSARRKLRSALSGEGGEADMVYE